MALSVTPVYAALLTLLFLRLSIRVIRRRNAAGISLGDGGDPVMLARRAAQGNFAEYTPFALLLLLVAELQGAPAVALHTLGVTLLLGRLAHATAFVLDEPIGWMRVLGMVLTFTMMLATAVGLFFHTLFPAA